MISDVWKFCDERKTDLEFIIKKHSEILCEEDTIKYLRGKTAAFEEVKQFMMGNGYCGDD